jgi:hypothetical protein
MRVQKFFFFDKLQVLLALLFIPLLTVLTASQTANAQQKERRSDDNIWEFIDGSTLNLLAAREIVPREYLTIRLNRKALARVLRDAPMELTEAARTKTVVLSLPLPDGTFARFAIEEAPIMEPALAAKFPGIKTYRGQGLDDAAATIRFDMTPLGFHAQVLSAGETVFIDPYSKGDTETYITYSKSDFHKDSEHMCLVETNGGEKGAPRNAIVCPAKRRNASQLPACSRCYGGIQYCRRRHRTARNGENDHLACPCQWYLRA